MSFRASFDSPERKPQKEQKNLVKVLDRIFHIHKKRNFEYLKGKFSMSEPMYKRTSTMTQDRSMTMDTSRMGNLAGISGIYNYSMMYKGDGRSVHFDLNESSNILDNSNFAFLNEENDEPTMKKKKSVKEVNKSTYLTFDAQMSRQFKAR